MLQHLQHKILILLQFLLVLTFILFEELIWEGIAKPLYTFVHSLKVLQKVEVWLHGVNASVILVIFVLMLVSVELLGIYAGVLFVSGQILLGIMLYISKIPIAAFTFWMFRVTEDKLMRFGWFKWIYGKIMAFIDWIKTLDIYRDTMTKIRGMKERIKVWIRAVKIQYFSRESPFVVHMKKLYRSMKQLLKQ